MKRALILLPLSAGALIISFAPFSLAPLAWIALIPLLFALEGRGKKSAFLTGLAWGLLFFTGTVYWVIHSMYYYGGVPAFIGSLVLVLLALYMSLYPALFGFVLSMTRQQEPLVRVITVASLWVALEYVRGVLFTGFPWVALGYSQASLTSLIQIADITGVEGVSFIVVAFNATLYWIITAVVGNKRVPRRLIILLISLVIVPALYGVIKTARVEERMEGWEMQRAGLAQGNIDQDLKWVPSMQQQTVAIYYSLSRTAVKDGAQLVLWPETAVPFFLQNRNHISEMALDAARDTGTPIITGSPAYRRGTKGGKDVEHFNSAFLITSEGEIGGRYDKVHLVPFGEYVPLKKLLFFISKLTEGVGDFSAGTTIVPLTVRPRAAKEPPRDGTVRVGTLICFESIFPELARGMVNNGANILAVMTNDGWFGRTSAPYQHFDMSVFRAVENRIYLLRAANTGISGFVDPTGKVIARSALFTRATLVEDVGLKSGPPTLYTTYGDVFPLICLIFAPLSILTARRGTRHYSN